MSTDTWEEMRWILLVEDDRAIREAVTAYLMNEGYQVTAVGDGQEALDEFGRGEYSLVVLDLMLPLVSGEQVCKTIRETSDLPIIMLTAKGEVEDRIAGLDLGADDYLVKPFSPRELVARVRALFRRVNVAEEAQHETISYGDLNIDVTARNVRFKGQDLDLTVNEFRLLVALSRYPGHVFTRGELVGEVLGKNFEGYERTIDTHIKNLRSKLGDDRRDPALLFTVHGVGYRLGNAL